MAPTPVAEFSGIICTNCGYDFNPESEHWRCPYCHSNYAGGWLAPAAYSVKFGDVAECQKKNCKDPQCRAERKRARMAAA